jgi:hypothetical protein
MGTGNIEIKLSNTCEVSIKYKKSAAELDENEKARA